MKTMLVGAACAAVIAFAPAANAADATVTGLAGGAVRVTGVDGHDPHLAPGSSQMLLVDDERCGRYTIGSKNSRGACRLVSNNQCKIRASAGLQARFCGAKAISARDDELRKVCHLGIQSGT